MPTSARPPHPWTAVEPITRYSDDPTPPFLLSTAQLLSPDALRPVPVSNSRSNLGHGHSHAHPDSRGDDQPGHLRHRASSSTRPKPAEVLYDPYDGDKDPPHLPTPMPGLHLPTPMPGLYDSSGNLLPDPADDDPTVPLRGYDKNRELDDPVIQTNAMAPFGPFRGMQNQELVNIPYRPMEPRLRKWAKSQIAPEDMVLPLLLISFQTGVVDAATIKDFHTYTTGQTGNSILMVLAIFGRRPSNLLAAGLSVAGFVLFAVVFGQLGNTYGHKTRGWLLFSMSVQIILLVTNIILVSPALAGVLPEGGPFEWAVIFTAAAGGAGQMVVAQNSGASEINTVGLTGLYCSIGADPTLFSILSKPHEIKRNRRLWFLVIFWGGCFMGGAIATYSDMWIGLVLALECKVVALAMMMLSSAFEVPEGWAERNARKEREKKDANEPDTWAD